MTTKQFQFSVGDYIVWKNTRQWLETFRSLKNKLREGPFTVTKVEERPGAAPLLTISTQINGYKMFYDGRRDQWVPADNISLNSSPYAGGPCTVNAEYFEKVAN
ncbi:hypothetical protein CL630_03435 [bacterium]|nr:hypothetical protein [bacterium]